MADPTTLPALIKAAVLEVPDLTFYDGSVPKAVPEAGGYIRPYVVLWAGIGNNPPELTSCGTQSQDTLIWDFQLTVVAADADICRRVGQAIKARLTNLQIGTGRVRPSPDAFNQQAPILDTQATPSRFMLPLQWRLITN
jgi:hypothetical protein